jgi:hypothetical protein
MAPPRENISLRQDLLRKAVLGLLQRGAVRLQVLCFSKSAGDCLVHPVGVNGAHDFGELFVDVFPPDGDADLLVHVSSVAGLGLAAKPDAATVGRADDSLAACALPPSRGLLKQTKTK